jgi:predicted Zn-dependent peptidase
MYNLKTYKNGLRVLVNEDNTNEAVAVIFQILAGGKDEDDSCRGVAHLAEHMFFKGTTTRTGKEIVFTFDREGIDYNAYTSQDLTTYFAEAMPNKLEKIFDMFSDCLFNANYPREELETEKQAVCSELEMGIDDSKQFVEYMSAEIALAGTPYQYVLGGTVSSVNKLSASDLKRFKDKFYTPNRLIISVCGKIKQSDVEALVEKYILSKCSTQECAPVVYNEFENDIKLSKRSVFTARDTDQYYCCVAFKPFSECNKDKLKFRAALSALGGTMSSRLFQKMRFERGLAYVVYSFYTQKVLSLNGMVFYTNVTKAKEAVQVLATTLAELRATGFTQEELEIAKNSLKTGYALACITPYAKANFGAKSLVYEHEIFDLSKMLADIEKITLQDINEFFSQYFRVEDMTVSVVSNKESFSAFDILSKEK